MNYPKYLIPRWYFRIFSLNDLDFKKNKYYSVRRSSKSTREETFDHLGLLKSESLIELDPVSLMPRLKEITGLSKNILGGFFTTGHLKFRAQGDAMKNWKGEKINIPLKKIIDCIKEIDHKPIPIYFALAEIHNQDFPFTKTIDKPYHKKLPEQFKALPFGMAQLRAQTEVLHKPTLSNFWHVEVHIKDVQTGEYFQSDKVSTEAQNVPLTQQKAGTQVAKSVLENILIKSGKSEMRSLSLISPVLYFKPLFAVSKMIRRFKR